MNLSVLSLILAARVRSSEIAPVTQEPGVPVGFLILVLVFAVFMNASFWKMFQKAGRRGWYALIPFYNVFVWVEITGRPIWLGVLQLFPFVNILFAMFLCTDTAKCFGKKTGFAMGLIFLPFVFFPILGFGSARYLGPVTDDSSPTTIG